MKMVKSLLLGTAAGIVALSGAQAADLPVKAKPVQYVKICSLYGAGFYYIPGTDTCIKIGGFGREEVNINSGGSFSLQTGAISNQNNKYVDQWRSRFGLSADVRSQTEYGTLRSYVMMASTSTNSQSGQLAQGQSGAGVGNVGGSALDPYTALWSNAAFIQFAGFTAGKLGSFFDYDLQPYSNQTNVWGSNLAGGGIDVFAYTAQLGNGLSASIAAEDAQGHRIAVYDGTASVLGAASTTGGIPALVPTTFAGWQYANQQVPDIIGNLRVDQAWGGAQVMAAYHQLDLMQGTTATANSINASGYALGAGVKINTPMIGVG
ncbi:MAG: porin, partial [Pseudolabrys sp.]